MIILIMYYSSSRFILPHRHLKVPVHGGHSEYIFLTIYIDTLYVNKK